MKYKKYDAYKDSGVQWLGDIPSDWEVVRFRDICTFSKGLNITKENLQDTGIPCVNYGEVHSKYGFEVSPERNELKCVSEDYLKNSPKSLLAYGDFIFADTSEDIDGSGNFTYLNSHNLTFAGYHTVIVRPKPYVNVRYLAYAFDSLSFRHQIRTAVKGVKVYSITKAILKDTAVWLPNVDQQYEIAQFLDQKKAQIEQAIAIKEQQIALLNERKQIVIQQAVTKGLDPNVKMKDSGVEWIGEIPEHWQLSKLRYLGVTQNGISAGSEYFGSGYPFVSYGDVYKNRQLPLSVDGLAKSSIADQKNYSVLEGDVFFTRTSETVDEIGFASICYQTIEKATFAGFLIRFRPTNANYITKEFSKYYFNAQMMRTYFVKEMNLVIRASLSQELLKNLIVLLPSIDEQKAIASYLDRQMDAINELIGLQMSAIQKLKEYKTTLINDAVTGKIKVA